MSNDARAPRTFVESSSNSPATASSARRYSRTWPVAAAAFAFRSSRVRLPADLSAPSASPCAALSADSNMVADSTVTLLCPLHHRTIARRPDIAAARRALRRAAGRAGREARATRAPYRQAPSGQQQPGLQADRQVDSHAASARMEADLLAHSLLYKVPELWAHGFEFIYLTLVELKEFEPLISC